MAQIPLNLKTPVPVRVQRRRTKGFNLQAASPNGLPVVCVDRSTIFGNPFRESDRVGFQINGENSFTTKITVHGEVKLYRFWFWDRYHNDPQFKEAVKWLKGRNLACWCGLDKECHADFLLEAVRELAR